MATLTINGASDDTIEVSGAISEEFAYTRRPDSDGDLVAVSDGTLLRIRWSGAGVWRITIVARGEATLTFEHAMEGDEDNYSDRVTLSGDVSWVVHGVGHAQTK